MSYIKLAPQPGPQTQMLSCGTDIVIAGGAAGGGKTWALLLDLARRIHTANMTKKRCAWLQCVFFRRNYNQIKAGGSAWDEANNILPLVGGRPVGDEFRFMNGARVQFRHLQFAKDRFSWKGAQLAWIGFDQLEEFEEVQFWFLMSRLRALGSSFSPYVMATCNPKPDSWLSELLQWWWDPGSGYAIPKRAGVARYFVRRDNEIIWADQPAELLKKFPQATPRSFTFVPSTLSDNPKLDLGHPEYRQTLEALPKVEREQLLNGNWKIRPDSGILFNRAWFPLVDIRPKRLNLVRYWDKAASENDGKFSAGVLMARDPKDRYFVLNVVRGQWSAHDREQIIRRTAETDGRGTTVVIEQEPGSGGKESAELTIKNLAGFRVIADKVTGPKLSRWGPLSAQSEAGNVYVRRGHWTPAFLDELHAATDDPEAIVDQVDAAAGAFTYLAAHGARRPGDLGITF